MTERCAAQCGKNGIKNIRTESVRTLRNMVDCVASSSGVTRYRTFERKARYTMVCVWGGGEYIVYGPRDRARVKSTTWDVYVALKKVKFACVSSFK